MSLSEQAMEFEQVLLERLQVRAQTAVSSEVLRSADLNMITNMAEDHLIASLESHVLAERLGSHVETATERIPASWWDAWKAESRWAGRWSRWVWQLAVPRYRTLHLKAVWTDYATFPHSTYQAPSDLGPVVFHRMSTSDVAWTDDA